MWNDKETAIDLLGHEKIAQTIIEIIASEYLRPLTIGVYGDWGVGKSSILSILDNKIKAEKKVGVSNSHCILFNGWLFQGYEDAKTALMETVITELSKLQPTDEKVKHLVKSLRSRVKWLKVAKLSAGVILAGLTGLPVGGIVGDLLTRSKNLTETDKDDSVLKEEDNDTVSSQIQAFRKEFKELIISAKVDHIIVMVDDLDRCLPKSVIEILEAIRLFLFVEGTTFVIAADERMIEYAVREHFPNLPASYQDYTKNYLEKLIQIPIRIPTLNKLQIGNYITLLMLQVYLKNDQEQLQKVYVAYSQKKKRPYEAVELSYEIITESIGSAPAELQESILVADQLTPTLSAGLKGNPRNVKRFLNTLFLRMKIARIYGLDDIVELKVLAKFMLLERFQREKFAVIIDEIGVSEDGISKTIKSAESKILADNPTLSTEDNSADIFFNNWVLLEPLLGKIDLRPYVFVSKEKAVSFDTDSAFPEYLNAIFKLLSSTNTLGLNQAEKELQKIPEKDRKILFDELEIRSRRVTDFKRIPEPINGLLRIIKVDASFEERFVNLLDSFPASELGVWAVSELSGLKSSEGIEEFQKLLFKWSEVADNKLLKTLASQNLKK